MAERELRLTGAAGEYMESATVVAWLKQPGEALREGESVVLVETAKATTEIPAPCDGALARILAATGSEVKVDGLLAVIETQDDAAPAPASAPTKTVVASPIARRLARENGVDLTTLAGTGPEGRIGERDVLAAIAARTVQPAPSQPQPQPSAPARTQLGADVYRRAMSRRMAAAAAIPQFSVTLSVDGSGIERLLATLKGGAGTTISANDVVMKAVALALREVPRFNARWVDGAAVADDAVNLGMAVATADGLAVPVIAACDRLSLSEIASASFRLRRRAIGRKLTSDDIARPSFTVSNLGLLGAEEFVALINPPEIGILAVGAFRPTPVARDGAVVVRPMAKLTVTGDHRAVDGADAAKLLVAIRALLEDASARLG
jgi:pyruvate dehydrogenase E2 component (dihydrolipoamide acetyltransferase)